VLDHALHAHRVAAADPFATDVSPAAVLGTRVGYGTGQEVADGRWTAARELPRPPRSAAREHALRPQERIAALLSGRDVALAAELLALRARLDLDHGRTREAALQLEAALAAAWRGAAWLGRAAGHAGTAGGAGGPPRRRGRRGAGRAEGCARRARGDGGAHGAGAAGGGPAGAHAAAQF
jgi:hypothetical protein